MSIYNVGDLDFRTYRNLAAADFLLVFLCRPAYLHLAIPVRNTVICGRVIAEYGKRALVLVNRMEAIVADGQLVLRDGVGLALLVLKAPALKIGVKPLDALSIHNFTF